MSNQPAPVKTTFIDRMTMDLFQSWLDFDLESITRNVQLLMPPIHIHNVDQAHFFRMVSIKWFATDDRTPIIDSPGLNIIWAQVRTDTIVIEFTANTELSPYIAEWLVERFGADAPTDNKPTFGNTPPVKLTPTEKKVAHLLTQDLDYEQIGVRLGDKSVHAARKHAQSLAKKWNTKQVLEILWSEAKKRGYSKSDTI